MKNYALFYKSSDSSKFIKDYLKKDNKLEVEMADGTKEVIDYSKSAESKIVNKIENQVRFTKKAKYYTVTDIMFAAAIMGLCAIAIPMNIMMYSFWPCLFFSGVSLVGVYAWAGIMIRDIKYLRTIKKERIYMANKKKFKKRGISIKQASAMKLRQLKKMVKGFDGKTSRKNLKIENIKFKKEQYESYLEMFKYFQQEEKNKKVETEEKNTEEVIEEPAKQRTLGTK